MTLGCPIPVLLSLDHKSSKGRDSLFTRCSSLEFGFWVRSKIHATVTAASISSLILLLLARILFKTVSVELKAISAPAKSHLVDNRTEFLLLA